MSAKKKKKPRPNTHVEPVGHGVFVHRRGGNLVALEHRQLGTLSDDLSPAILVPLIGALGAAERLYALADLASIKEEHRGSTTLARERNLHAIHLLALSTMHEAMGALERLRGAGIRGRVGPEFQPWHRLDEMRKRWRQNLLLARIRNALGHHLGLEEIEKGIAKIPNGSSTFFVELAGPRLLDVRHPVALRAILAGAEFDQDEFAAGATAAIKDGPRFAVDVQHVMIELLRRTGADLPDVNE